MLSLTSISAALSPEQHTGLGSPIQKSFTFVVNGTLGLGNALPYNSVKLFMKLGFAYFIE